MRISPVSLSPLCFWLVGAVLACAQDAPNEKPPGPSATRSAGRAAEDSKEITPMPATLSIDQIKDLIRQAAEKDIENDKKERDYTYSERVEEHQLDGHGQVKKTEVRLYDVLEIYGEQVERLISKGGKRLSDKEAAKEEARIQKIIDHRKNESDSDRAKRLKKEEKERDEGREFVKEVADAYNFTFVGTEKLGGRDSYVIEAEPRAGFEPKTKEGKILTKFRFRLWLDRAEDQWVKLDASCIDTVTWGLFLARIHKGTHLLVETARVNDEVWLPQHIAVHIDVRLALLKNFAVDEDLTYKYYKKFHAESRIVGMEEVKEVR